MMRKTIVVGLLPLLLLSGTAFAADTDETRRLKEMLDSIGEGDVSPELLKAFVDNRLPEVGTVGVWADYRRTELDDDRRANAKEAESDSYSVGLDYRLTRRTTIGLALVDQVTETESDVSSGSARGYSVIDDDTRGIGIYATHLRTNGLALDASLTFLETDTEITDFSALAPPSTKSTDGDSVALDLGASTLYPLQERLAVSGRVSFSYVEGDQDGYTDQFGRAYESQDYELGTLGLDVNVNYAATRTITPYAGVNFGYDIISDVGAPARVQNPGGSIATSVPYQDERDDASYGFQLGVGWRALPEMRIDASYRQQNWGSNLTAEALGVNLRWSF
jgi:outer membrane autotransporter protein